MTTYLMNPNTGTVDTLENWNADFESMNTDEWGSINFRNGLVEVVKNEEGDWVEK